ncbi:MAG: hypothetical protein EOP48_03050 [Sphingobacteriales bacterium]|nr:MAG: hypothetical protein EOP48_03050 [Sphingobacteriales bacterium]
MKSTNFSNCIINWQNTIPGEIAFQECNFDHGQIIWPVTSSIPNYVFNECKFKGQEILLLDLGIPSRTFEKCIFENCKLANLRLDLHSVKGISFIDCSGYVLLEDRAKLDKQLEPFKNAGTYLHYKRGDLFYIPLETWNKSGKNIKQFEQNIIKVNF